MLHLLIIGLVILSFARPESDLTISITADIDKLIFKPRR